MRRCLVWILCLLLFFGITATCHAASSASSATLSATVAENGSCQITVEMQLHLESAADGLTFPLPKGARNVTVNGSTARTKRSGDLVHVELDRLLGGATGDFSLHLQYTVPNVIGYNELNHLQLTLPLLSGFSYPVEGLQFSVILPGEVEGKPAFFSGYHQQSIEAEMTCSVEGNKIFVQLLTGLKDRETLTMTLGVSNAMFPQNPTSRWSVGVADVCVSVFVALALVYWLVFLRCAPLRRKRCTLPPQGLTAGQMSTALIGQGAQLTMMVLSWAQLGYIGIQLEKSGRVLLHKRMDMGNERSGYENRIFKSLFGKRSTVDGTGQQYALMCRKVAAKADVKEVYRRRSGNPLIFRALCAMVGFFGGISLGILLAGDAVLGILLVAILAILGAVSAWFMQQWVKGLHLNNKMALYIGLGLSVLWMLLGIAVDSWNIAATVILVQLVGGLMWAYGGKRTPVGRQTAVQILGFRHYLHHLSSDEAYNNSRMDPDFYFNMVPYAMALGVHGQFARRFGHKRLPACPYLTTGQDGRRTALEWCEILERTVAALDDRQKRMPLDRLMGK